ncbi:ribonuclease H-like domain-containing protein [Tanacetum coccineum]
MTGNKAYLDEFQDFNGGPVAFGGSRGYITGKGKIKTGKLDFEDVCFVKELQHFNLFSVSQICDKKNKVLFTDSECLVLSPEFKLPDENQVLLKIPRQNNMYSFNLENIVPTGGLACLIAKATTDESNKWHRRLGHVNFKNLNKLVKGNLVRGLPSKIFQKDHTCVLCQKGKATQGLIVSKAMDKREYSIAELHNKHGVAKRKNRTLIEAARTMLADSFVPNTFWAEADRTALLCQQEANQNAGTEEIIDVGDSDKEDDSAQDCFVLPIRPSYSSTNTPTVTTDDKRAGPREEEQVFMDDVACSFMLCRSQELLERVSSSSVDLQTTIFNSFNHACLDLITGTTQSRQHVFPTLVVMYLSCLLEEQLLEPALNLTVHCCGREFRVLNCYDQNPGFSDISLFSNQTLSPSFLGLKDVPALKLRVPALTSRVCSHSYCLNPPKTTVLKIYPSDFHLRPDLRSHVFLMDNEVFLIEDPVSMGSVFSGSFAKLVLLLRVCISLLSYGMEP